MTATNVRRLLEEGLRLHTAGQLKEAEAAYNQVLRQQPENADALHFLGVIANQVGRNDAAVKLIRRAIALNPSDAGAYCNLGNALRDSGQLDEAIAACRQSITLNPNLPEAHNNLGNALRDRGQLDEAIAACRQAIALRPNYAEAHSNLGIALLDHGELNEAMVALRRAIALRPDYAEAHNNLGTALMEQGELDEAIAAFRHAIAVSPDRADVHSNLGVALRDKGQLDEAMIAFRRAIAIRPSYAEAHNSLGNALKGKGRLDDALAAFRQAIDHRPNYAEAHNNLGAALMDQGELDQAIAAFRKAIAHGPKHAEAHSNLGVALRDKGELDEAIIVYRQAISLNPNLPEAHSNLGNALSGKGHFNEAIAAHRQAIALRSNYAEAFSNLGMALRNKGDLDGAIAACQRAIALNPALPEVYSNLGNCLKDKGQLDESIAAYRQAMALAPSDPKAHSDLILTLHYHHAYAQTIAEECRHWNRRHAEPLRKLIQSHSNDPTPDRRLRIGYVSPDFRRHPVGRFMLPLLGAHDRRAFEIFCYAQTRRPDQITAELQAHADIWRSIVNLSDSQVADTIRQDRIDILVDLAMHTADNRLLVFAQKPAPMQATYLAYAGGTGLDTIDYRLTDRYLDPNEANDVNYVEKSIRLDGTYWCYPLSNENIPINQLPALTAGRITLGCLNNFCKVTNGTLETWATLLRDLPNARLLFYSPAGSHHDGAMRFFKDRGIAADRLEIVGRVSPGDYLATYNRIDIALDTFPYAGGATTCDALWMGVPVVTLASGMAVGRAGVSILSNAGLPELIAQTPEQYERIVLDLASDLRRLAELRAALRQRLQSSLLMDADRLARGIENAYRIMWRNWCEK
jgi:protein O-GlcNAc transferase